MKYLLASSVAVVLLIFIIVFLQYSFFKKTDVDSFVVATTIFPLADIAKQVAGEYVDVEYLIPAGASPHTFEPTPTTQKILEKADIIFAIGHGYDDWVTRLAPRNTRVVLVDREIQIREGDEPHYWLSLTNGAKISKTIRDTLIQLLPTHAEQIRSRSEMYEQILLSAHEKIKQELSVLKNRNLVTFHDAWYYFADAYDLRILGTFEPTAGREPTPKYLTELSKIIRSNNLEVLYGEPQFSTQGMEAFLSDHNAKIAILDPIGGSSEIFSYLDLFTVNAQTIFQNQ